MQFLSDSTPPHTVHEVWLYNRLPKDSLIESILPPTSPTQRRRPFKSQNTLYQARKKMHFTGILRIASLFAVLIKEEPTERRQPTWR